MIRRSTLPRTLAALVALLGIVLATTAVAPAQAATTGILPTKTTVTPSATTVAYGTPVTFSSTVSLLGTGLIVIPTGTVTYTAVSGSGSQVLGTSTLSGCVLMPCTTSLTTTALAAGANTITASYSGNGPTIINSSGIGSNNQTTTVLLVGPSSATTSVFVTKPPSAPQDLVVTAGVEKNTLTWSAPADPGSSPVTSYTVNRKTGTNPYSALATVPATSTTYVDNTAASGTSYTYTVVANNSAGASSPSNSASGTPVAAATAPSAPVLTATGQVASIKLDWASASNGGSPITEYRLYRRVTGSGNPFALIAEDLPTGDYQDTTVIIGVTYDYQATTVNAVGSSPMSNTATASASPFAGPSSYDTKACTAGSTCSSATASAVDPDTGNATESSITVESSSGPHTATVAVGGPKLTGCSVPNTVGLSSTFNDTSTDAYKTVLWVLNGSDAAAWDASYSSVPAAGEFCLGLGTPWTNPFESITWVPADGLYEGHVVACVNAGGFAQPGGHYSIPCYTKFTITNGSPNFDVIRIEFTLHLPPGDGKISGGS